MMLFFFILLLFFLAKMWILVEYSSPLPVSQSVQFSVLFHTSSNTFLDETSPFQPFHPVKSRLINFELFSVVLWYTYNRCFIGIIDIIVKYSFTIQNKMRFMVYKWMFIMPASIKYVFVLNTTAFNICSTILIKKRN